MDGIERALPTTVPTNWTQTTDVVVVGYGGSGAVAAITASDAGAQVLVLEKTPSIAQLGITGTTDYYTISGGGGNSHMSMGNTGTPTNAAEAAEFLYAMSWGKTPMDVCQAWANMAVNNAAWYTKMGIAFTTGTTALVGGFANLPGASSYRTLSVTGGGPALFAALDQAVQSRNIPVLFNTPATELVQDPTTGEILGVKAMANGSEMLNIKANRAVVLCCGSFEYDETMKLNYLPGYPAHFASWPANTGDGIKMAQAVGAGLWHMTGWSAALGAWQPGYGPTNFSVSVKSPGGWIYVDTTGNRFCNESDVSGYGDSYAYELTNFNVDAPQYQRIPTFLVFDSVGIKAGAVGPTAATALPPALGGSTYIWSASNQTEINAGWIIEGPTSPSDLANAINASSINSVPPDTVGGPASQITFNISPTTLTNTINAYNGYCANGVDTQFGRPKTALVPLQTPPFYAIPLWPGGPNNMGGPIRNAMGQVCDPYNNPIPRLYSAGECGSIWGFFYPGAGNLSECLVFGQISGHNAAQENPVTS